MIVLPARDCPPEILARTRNANSAASRARNAGWDVSVRFAIGGEDDAEIQSIVLRLWRGDVKLTARWAGPLGQESLNFDGAWRARHAVVPITWTQFSWAIENPDSERPSTAAELAKLDQDQLELLGAIRVAAEGLSASPARVLPAGTKDDWCRGHVIAEGGGIPAMRRRCINPAAPGDHLCAGPCRGSIDG